MKFSDSPLYIFLLALSLVLSWTGIFLRFCGA